MTRVAGGYSRSEPPVGEWLYKVGDEVYGPVGSDEIVQKLFEGELDEASVVSLDDGPWIELGKIEPFQPFIYQAKAHLRALQAKREAEAARKRRLRRQRLQVAAVAVFLVLASFACSYLLIVYKPWRDEKRIQAWAAKHVPLLAVASAFEGKAETPEDDFDEIDVKQILIDDAPALVAISPVRRTGKKAASLSDRRKKPSEGKKGKFSTPAGKEVDKKRTTASLGQLSNEEITRIVYSRANLGRLIGCLRAEAKRNKDLPAQVVMEFTIANNGRVSQVRMDDPRLDGGPLHRCFQRKLSLLKFRPFTGQVRNVTIPFNVRP